MDIIPASIIIGARLNETTALQVTADLAQIDFSGDERLVLDFSATTHFEPFGMLFLGSAVRRLQHRALVAKAEVIVKLPSDADSGIAGHMGFWQSMGVPVGRPINAPAGRESYLPVTRLDLAELFSAGGGDPRGTGVVEAEAGRLARILAGDDGKALEEALTYSLRELMRNVIEHAMTPSIWVSGMSWPKRGFLQIAILDEGRGVRHSLADNPDFRFGTDALALREAIRHGVTRNRGRARSQAEIERWEDARHIFPLELFNNTGYGLYMISSLCREAGQFLIASGNSYLGFIASAELSGATLHRGTALRLVMEPTKVPAAFERLFESIQGQTGAGSQPLISASTLRRLGLDSLTSGSD